MDGSLGLKSNNMKKKPQIDEMLLSQVEFIAQFDTTDFNFNFCPDENREFFKENFTMVDNSDEIACEAGCFWLNSNMS